MGHLVVFRNNGDSYGDNFGSRFAYKILENEVEGEEGRTKVSEEGFGERGSLWRNYVALAIKRAKRVIVGHSNIPDMDSGST